MTRDPLDETANAESLRQLRAAGVFTAAAFERALEIAAAVPTADDWRRFLDRLLLLLGAALLLAGVVFFFAWNWADMGRFTKFAVLQAALLTMVLVAWRLGLDRLPGQAALFGAALLPGVLLAVYGQTYQTGADPYGLLALWAALILGWVIIGRNVALWVLWLVLANLALMLWWGEVWRPRDNGLQMAGQLGPILWISYLFSDAALAYGVFVFNVLALALYQRFRSRTWLRGRLLPRLAASLALTALVVPVLVFIFRSPGHSSDVFEASAPLLYAGVCGAALWYFRERQRDLFILAGTLFSIIVVVTAFLIDKLHTASGLLIVGVLVVAQSAAAAAWLRKTAKYWDSQA